MRQKVVIFFELTPYFPVHHVQRKLELLEVERIRRIKATEEKYLRQTHDKYGELKKRRSQAYQSEKEISKYKRDYAVAKQK